MNRLEGTLDTTTFDGTVVRLEPRASICLQNLVHIAPKPSRADFGEVIKFADIKPE
jgi:hypothetical protein